MFRKLFYRFKDDRKFFAIVFFVLFLFLLSGIITPVIVNNLKENWKETLTQKISDIKNSVLSFYKEKENHLLVKQAQLKENLVTALTHNTSYRSLIRLINNKHYQDYSIEVFAPNGRLIAWNGTVAIRQEDLFPLKYPFGEVHFDRNKLITYITLTDTLHIDGDTFFFTVSSPIEKHYTIQNPYYIELSFTKEISDEFLTQFEVYYNPFVQHTRDGRKHSFEIINNKNNKTGLVTFVKPALDTTIKTFYADVSKIQSFLAVVGFLFIALGYRKDFRSIKFRVYRLLILTIYFSAFRILLYYLNFPSNIMSGAPVNPAYFSSAFGGGIVKSPVEFFITVLFALILCIMTFRYLINFIQSGSIEKYKGYKTFLFLLLPLSFLFFMTLRGLSAAIRSVIFDSTLRYFKDPTLIPDLPSIIMNLNVLMLGTGVVFLLCSYIILLLEVLPKMNRGKLKKIYIVIFLLVELFGVLFILVQKQPLIVPVFSLFFVLLVFVLIYHIYFLKQKSVFNYVYATLCASIITITLLNFFNIGLEREALKTTALELNRPNDNLLRFMINETLTNAVRDESLIRVFSRENHNFNATAFRLWTHSSLQKESLNSSVVIYNRFLQPTGRFETEPEEKFNPVEHLPLPEDIKPEVREVILSDSSKIFAGIIPIADEQRVLGFVAASVDANVQNLVSSGLPEFLESKKNILSSVLDIGQLKIFEFINSRLTNVTGDIYPSRDQVKPLLDTPFSYDNEAWTSLVLNNEKYTTYLLRSELDGSEKITAVSLREKHFTWNLYNFFKIFIIHSIFILALFLTLFVFEYHKFKYSFRIQLLISFLIISILPVVVLAVYNRIIVTERSEAEVLNELNERSQYLENHILIQMEKNPDRDFTGIFDNARHELGISFSVYDGTEQIYSSRPMYYDAGLFEQKLNPEVHYNLSYLSYREFFSKEKVEGFAYSALYKRVILNERNFIIEVNDAFNKVNITFSVIDVDIFLFGVYSFAVIIIIISSPLLANRISSPIRRLTKATDSVAHGDLNVYLENTAKGEIKDLFDGFNLMTKELKKNETDLAELERESAWKEMAKQVAHEIKNPLTPMKLAVQQLIAAHKDANKNFNDMFEKLSVTILNQIENLSQIASEFSRFAKMPNLNLEEVNLIPVINDTINLFVDEKIKIDVKSEFNKALVETDKSQMRRMIINFIRNSIQAEATRIKFEIKAEGNNILILIEDNGNGIPENVKDKIFETNFTTKIKGMGIGLKLARRFLEGTNGKIELVKSSVEGTLFRISIPAIK
ncbi:MAG: HAMP domain-containing sensor histidine kinase [Ignavibacteriaceae bacterium]